MTHENEATLERHPGTSAQERKPSPGYDLTKPTTFSLAVLTGETAPYHGCEAWIERAQSAKDLVLWACELLNYAPSARAMLEFGLKDGWSVGLSPLGGDGYSLDFDEGIIYLDDNGFDSGVLGRSVYLRYMLLMSLVRALRDIWHDAFDDDIKGYVPESILMRERLITAEIETFTAHVAWELRSTGYNQVWRCMIGSHDGDLAMSLARILEHNPASFMQGRALVHVIRQWFKKPERIAAADHRALEYMDEVLRRREDRCVNPFGEHMLGTDDLLAHTKLPEGGSYLNEAAHLVLADARHYGLQNPVNKAHFDHIKHDIEASVIADVPFRDADLGHRIFAT